MVCCIIIRNVHWSVYSIIEVSRIQVRTITNTSKNTYAIFYQFFRKRANLKIISKSQHKKLASILTSRVENVKNVFPISKDEKSLKKYVKILEKF